MRARGRVDVDDEEMWPSGVRLDLDLHTVG